MSTTIRIRSETRKRLQQLSEELATQTGQQLSEDALINLLIQVYTQHSAFEGPQSEETSEKAQLQGKKQFIALKGRKQLAIATSLRDLAHQLTQQEIDPKSVQLTMIPTETKSIRLGFRTRRRPKRDADN